MLLWRQMLCWSALKYHPEHQLTLQNAFSWTLLPNYVMAIDKGQRKKQDIQAGSQTRNPSRVQLVTMVPQSLER